MGQSNGALKRQLVPSLVDSEKIIKNDKMGESALQENWRDFIDTTKAKAESHEKVAQYWDRVHNNLGLILILLSAVTTVLTALAGIPKLVITGVSGVTTLFSAVAGFLQPAARKQVQEDSAKGFRLLMMRMVHCETTEEYEELWKEYTKMINAEPFVPEKYEVKDNHEHSMTPELTVLMAQKEVDVQAALINVKGGVVNPMMEKEKADASYGSCATVG